MLYVKTDAGRAELQSRSRALTPAQRQALILCDGDRHVEDLMAMMPPEALKAAVEHLAGAGLIQLRVAQEKVVPAAAPMTESERYTALLDLATSMAGDLGFTARIKAQLQIEKAQSVQDLAGVVELLGKHLKATPLVQLRLEKLRQLVTH